MLLVVAFIDEQLLTHRTLVWRMHVVLQCFMIVGLVSRLKSLLTHTTLVWQHPTVFVLVRLVVTPSNEDFATETTSEAWDAVFHARQRW